MAPSDRTLSRRLALGMLTATAATGTSAARAENVQSLKSAAARAGLRFGATSDVDINKIVPDYARLFVTNCDFLALQMGWDRTQPVEHGPDPVWQDPNMGFAASHGFELTGGHLLWHLTTPAWFGEMGSRKLAEAAVTRHISSMQDRYGNLTYAWNVVNEAIEPRDSRPDGLRDSVLLRQLGNDYIANAFFTARSAAPSTMLVYNDYGFEFTRPDDEARRVALLRLLDRLLAAKAPIDAVGLQSHLQLGNGRFDPMVFRGFLREIATRGLRILITELDVLDLGFNPTIAGRDAEVAALYTAFLDTALDEPAVRSVVTWGLVDQYSWYNLWSDRMFKRWDRQPTRPLLFDNAFHPKPAYYAVLQSLQRASARPHK